MKDLTPKQIVAELDNYIIGQSLAKRAVAVAIRNRWRRRQLDDTMAKEVYPKNIIMVGPTGVGKTEIARRLAKITEAPFIKVEASKFTEVGYHGRDVESMIRDLLDQAMGMVRAQQAEEVKEKAQSTILDKLVDLLLPSPPSSGTPHPQPTLASPATDPSNQSNSMQQTRKHLAKQIESGALDESEVEIEVVHKPQTQVMFSAMGMDQMDPDMANMFEKLIPEQSKTRKVTIAQARSILHEQETEKLLDRDKITALAIEQMQENGIIFLDEIDKIASPTGGGGKGGSGGGGSPDVSRQGVQRDLLPIVEGSSVNTRYGTVQTDHVLFIAAGAFHSASVTDLMPELQGRFPIRVELDSLNKQDFIRILTEPDNALTKQQQALLKVEGMTIDFADDGIDAMADLAAQANADMENIGARRLMTIIEKVFEEINFDAPQRVAQGKTQITIDDEFVRKQVQPILDDKDLSQFVL